MNKICRHCKELKLLSDFHKRAKSIDGHGRLCKKCDHIQRMAWLHKKRENKEWHEAEKLHRRTKSRDEKWNEKYKSVHSNRSETSSNYLKKYPEKYNAHIASQRMPKLNDSSHLHHWSYNEQHHKDVIELSIADHSKSHSYMVYDQQFFMYRRSDTNELLDTRRKHEDFILNFLKDKP